MDTAKPRIRQNKVGPTPEASDIAPLQLDDNQKETETSNDREGDEKQRLATLKLPGSTQTLLAGKDDSSSATTPSKQKLQTTPSPTKIPPSVTGVAFDTDQKEEYDKENEDRVTPADRTDDVNDNAPAQGLVPLSPKKEKNSGDDKERNEIEMRSMPSRTFHIQETVIAIPENDSSAPEVSDDTIIEIPELDITNVSQEEGYVKMHSAVKKINEMMIAAQDVKRKHIDAVHGIHTNLNAHYKVELERVEKKHQKREAFLQAALKKYIDAYNQLKVKLDQTSKDSNDLKLAHERISWELAKVQDSSANQATKVAREPTKEEATAISSPTKPILTIGPPLGDEQGEAVHWKEDEPTSLTEDGQDNGATEIPQVSDKTDTVVSETPDGIIQDQEESLNDGDTPTVLKGGVDVKGDDESMKPVNERTEKEEKPGKHNRKATKKSTKKTKGSTKSSSKREVKTPVKKKDVPSSSKDITKDIAKADEEEASTDKERATIKSKADSQEGNNQDVKTEHKVLGSDTQRASAIMTESETQPVSTSTATLAQDLSESQSRVCELENELQLMKDKMAQLERETTSHRNTHENKFSIPIVADVDANKKREPEESIESERKEKFPASTNAPNIRKDSAKIKDSKTKDSKTKESNIKDSKTKGSTKKTKDSKGGKGVSDKDQTEAVNDGSTATRKEYEHIENKGDGHLVPGLKSEIEALKAALGKKDEEIERLKNLSLAPAMVPIPQDVPENKKSDESKQEEIQTQVAEKNAEIVQLKAELEKISAEKLENQAQLEQSMQSHSQVQQELASKLEELQKEFQDTSAQQSAEIQEKLQQAENTTKEKDTAIATLKADLGEKTLQNEDLKSKVQSMEAQIASLSGSTQRIDELESMFADQTLKYKAEKKEKKALKKQNEQLEADFKEQSRLRRKYYNIIEDMKGKVRVYCRARPLSGSENERGNTSCVSGLDEFALRVIKNDGIENEFTFDRFFTPNHTQEDVYEDTGNLIQSAVDGYNVCIFAYGQTGSGKTFTMIGDSNRPMNAPGIAPRAFKDIFRVCEETKSTHAYRINVYMVELYCGELIDLLNEDASADSSSKRDSTAFGGGSPGKDKGKTALKIRKNKKGLVYVEGLTMKEAQDSDQLYELFETGSQNRHISSHKMNAESSRSHLIIGVVVETVDRISGQVTTGKLSIVDLAGSERFDKTGATGKVAEEAKSINKSLQALAEVINALSEEKAHVPYRNSLLTQLMQDSLGGNAKTLMFVNISPADYNANETVAALRYAQRAKMITNDANKNSDTAAVTKLNKKIEQLEAFIQDLQAEKEALAEPYI